MNFIIYLISFFNLAGLGYLTFLFYKKYLPQKHLSATPLNLDNTTKIKLHRFNPFDDVGSDQSFILCLLDQTNSGVIITSLHARNLTRFYAKAIKNGQPVDSSLSKEEKSVILKAIKG
jgi:hypothetical protein